MTWWWRNGHHFTSVVNASKCLKLESQCYQFSDRHYFFSLTGCFLQTVLMILFVALFCCHTAAAMCTSLPQFPNSVKLIALVRHPPYSSMDRCCLVQVFWSNFLESQCMVWSPWTLNALLFETTLVELLSCTFT